MNLSFSYTPIFTDAEIFILRRKAFRYHKCIFLRLSGAHFFVEEYSMDNETRVATIAMIVEDDERVAQINSLLHDYGQYIVGRMGIPYHSRGLNIINIVLDAPADIISALSGKLGRLKGVTAKAMYSKQTSGQ